MMWSLLPLVISLGVTNDNLELANARTTYGPLGAVRTDEKILPGDQVALSFDIVGAKADASGKVHYSIAMEVTDSQGKVLFKQAPRDMEAAVPADSKTLPACATLDVGNRQPPGEYGVKVTVKDLTSGATQEVTRKYELLPKGFGLVRYSTTRDPDGRLPVAALRSRRPGWINFSAVGFERDPATGQPDVAVEMRVLDQNNQPVMKPAHGEIKQDVPKGIHAMPMQFEVDLPNHGEFTVELSATDKVSGQKAALKVPLRISGQN
jgi:hypothetical protein